jgi:ATP-binding cassette, subfamily B, bacterial
MPEPYPTTPHPTGRSSPLRLRGLWRFVRPYRWHVAFALVLLGLAASTALLLPWALRGLIDAALAAGRDEQHIGQLERYFGWLGALVVAMGVLSALRFHWFTWLGERVTADVRQAVYDHVLQQSPEFFETTKSGEVASRLTTDTTLIQTVVGSSLSMGLRNAVMGTGALVMLVWSHPWAMVQVLAVVLLVVLPAVGWGRRVRRLSRASQDRVADTSGMATEVLAAMPLVQSYTAEARESRRFADATEAVYAVALQRSRARSGLLAFVMVSTGLLVIWGLYLGSQAVLAGRMTAGELGQSAIYAMFFASAVAVLGEVYGEVLRAAGASERLVELLGTVSPVRAPSQPQALPARTGGSDLVLDRVTFHYPSRPDRAALNGVSLQVGAGETVALVGPSGAGKSTVFGLLLRFYDCQSGSIRLNGVPVDALDLPVLRGHMGLVAQDPVIFSASALDNIRYGKPDATLDEVKAAAEAAHAHGFIEQLPEGYQTFLGERGVRLSGGQRQRIAIARAILKNPPLLLLDEATSALDTHSERAVQAALESAMSGRTTLVIAHRLSTVQKADRIVVLDHGRVVEQGTHAELLAHGGLYASLAALQFQD